MLFQIGFEQSLCFIDLPAWNGLVQAEPAEEAAPYRRSGLACRARGKADTGQRVVPVPAGGTADDQQRRGAGIARMARTQPGRSRQGARRTCFRCARRLADRNRLRARLSPRHRQHQCAEVGKLLANPLSCISGSDAGAHLQMFCAAGDHPAAYPVCARARRLEPRGGGACADRAAGGAARLGRSRRDRCRHAADVIVFALDELVYGGERLVNDLPGGLPRLTRDPAALAIPSSTARSCRKTARPRVRCRPAGLRVRLDRSSRSAPLKSSKRERPWRHKRKSRSAS